MRLQIPTAVAAFAITISTCTGHGIVTSPRPRAVGPASASACGDAITAALRADNQTFIEDLYTLGAADPDYDPAACRLDVCKGLQLADNLDNVQVYVGGQSVRIQVWTRIPHKGWASVAIVDARTGLLVGDGKQLARFETEAASGFRRGVRERGVQDPDYEVEITVPKLFPRCRVPGECVIQWTWFGRVVHHIYESCIDFVVADEPFLSDTAAADAHTEAVAEPQGDAIVPQETTVKQQASSSSSSSSSSFWDRLFGGWIKSLADRWR